MVTPESFSLHSGIGEYTPVLFPRRFDRINLLRIGLHLPHSFQNLDRNSGRVLQITPESSFPCL
jgi:hypothetical protein